MLTGTPPYAPGSSVDVLDEFDFCARMRGVNLHLVHERANNENAPARGFQQILGCQGIGNLVGVQPLTLVSNRDHEILSRSLKCQCYFLSWVVGVAMQHGVDRG